MLVVALGSDCGRSRTLPGDTDGDGVSDDGDESRFAGDRPCATGETAACDDNCPNRRNPHQRDSNADGKGDVCDPDDDGDGVPDGDDNCLRTRNADQADDDDDDVGDACDQCPDSDVDDDVNAGGCS
jgi:hypothetical protein